MKINAIIEKGNDGTFDVHFDPHCETELDFSLLGQGITVQEAISDFYSAFEEMKKVSDDARSKDIVFTFCYDVASFLSYYANKLTLSGLEKITGINQSQLSHYVTGKAKPRQSTIKKMETSLHNFGKEIQELNFV